jgi:hypothetical protein
MAANQFKPIVISMASPAATYTFFTSGYQPPNQPRYIQNDVVKNQNGQFKWVYDNGPGFRTWSPFKIHCENAPYFPGSATQQLSDLTSLWNHVGVLGMRTPEGSTFHVIWADNALEQNFRIFPKADLPVGKLEYIVTVQFEEAN